MRIGEWFSLPLRARQAVEPGLTLVSSRYLYLAPAAAKEGALGTGQLLGVFSP
jgi:hypothetical protein